MTAQERHMQASPSKWSRRLGIRSAGGVAVQSQSRESLSFFVLRISRTRPARLCRDVFLLSGGEFDATVTSLMQEFRVFFIATAWC